MFEWIQHAPNAMEVSTIELSTIELQLRRTVKRSSRQARPAHPRPERGAAFGGAAFLSLFLSAMVVQWRLEAHSVAARRGAYVRMRLTTTTTASCFCCGRSEVLAGTQL